MLSRSMRAAASGVVVTLLTLLIPFESAIAEGGQGVEVKSPSSGTYVGRWNGERYSQRPRTVRQSIHT